MDSRKIVVPLTLLAAAGVLLPLTGVGPDWLPAAGWAMALAALAVALWVVASRPQRGNHRNQR
ncbi:hypothetical protein [Corynebacterium kalidii]|uniref:Uncharacterized protein n=1 Tax=Corynebacterium kalidii TaxID=2931982 RepID=A0A9X1WHF2_9CORY|nr:hypothetical protein [Corynebacterium kalidii]MCJ7859089.1 hypothetical protein [Corynebacterium kalidii]